MMPADAAIARYHALDPAGFGVLISLSIAQSWPSDAEIAEMTLEMELRPLDRADRRRLVLTFAGVRDLSIRPFGFPVQFPLIEIGPIQDRACEEWEVLGYKVVETEDLSLSFYCASFDARITEP